MILTIPLLILNKKELIVVLGPTAVGKTKVAIDLAKYYNTEIVSFDSRQFYKETTVGTAVPTKEELESVIHHFIQNKSIHQSYSVGDYEKEATHCIANIFSKKDKAILAGGSGLFEKAVTKGLDDFPLINQEIRLELEGIFKISGISELQKILAEKDPEYYKKVDKQNHRRLIRALEVCLSTLKPYSSFLAQKPNQNKTFFVVKIGLEIPRETLYEKINERVDKMMEDGLLQEAEKLYPYKQLNALQTVGYSELFNYLDNKITLAEAINEIKKNTRHYAKRQITWYKKDKEVNWFKPTEINQIKDFLGSI